MHFDRSIFERDKVGAKSPVLTLCISEGFSPVAFKQSYGPEDNFLLSQQNILDYTLNIRNQIWPL